MSTSGCAFSISSNSTSEYGWSGGRTRQHRNVAQTRLVSPPRRTRLAAHGLRQLPAVLEAHVSGGRAHQPRDRVLLRVLVMMRRVSRTASCRRKGATTRLTHVDADDVLFRVEQLPRERLGALRLAHARGAEEQEGGGLGGVGEARARAQHRVRHRGHRRVLADHLRARTRHTLRRVAKREEKRRQRRRERAPFRAAAPPAPAAARSPPCPAGRPGCPSTCQPRAQSRRG